MPELHRSDTGPGIRYQILGNLCVRKNGRNVTPSARKIQMLLSTLLISSGQMVSVDRLTSEIWGDSAPRRSLATVQVYVSQLRKSLSTGAGDPSPIVTAPSGYILQLGPNEFDMCVFQHKVRRGRTLARDNRHDEAVEQFDGALRLWRGPVLGGLWHSPRAAAFATSLEETRLECLELLVESNLALGRHRELVSMLHSMVVEHPFREVFHRQLMLALYRSERRAEALEVYRSTRELLHAELGLEPCWALRDLQHAILLADASLDAVPARSR
jgi:DNA-binding SARP family transcriptional activator